MFTSQRDFFHHAASLDQSFLHCRIFSATATRRCMDRVSVPSVGVTLSGPLSVIALVSRYLTNKLILRRPFPKRIAPFNPEMLSGISPPFGKLSPSWE